MSSDPDGHPDAVLKPAFHAHAEHAAHAEDDVEVSRFTEESDSHADSGHCQPCVDIPVSFGLPDGCSKLSKPQPRPQISSLPVHPNTALETIGIFKGVSEPFYISTPYFDPLHTVILLV